MSGVVAAALTPLLSDLITSIVRGAGHDIGRKGVDSMLRTVGIGGGINAPNSLKKRTTQGSKRSYAKNKGPRAYIPVRIRG